MTYDFSEYTAEELATFIVETEHSIAVMTAWPKLSKPERAQIAHDQSMLADAIAERARRNPTYATEI